MCNKRNSKSILLRNGYIKVDSCIPKLLQSIEQTGVEKNKITTIASCCGHGKYNMTIIVKDEYSPYPHEILTGKTIPRIRNFYKKDKQGFYFIPEIANGFKK